MDFKETILMGNRSNADWPEELKGYCDKVYNSSDGDLLSIHSTIPVRELEVSFPLFCALTAYANLQIDKNGYKDAAYGKKGNGGRFAELQVDDNKRNMAYITDAGFIYAAEGQVDINKYSTIFDIDQKNPSVILLALMEDILSEAEAKECFQTLEAGLIANANMSKKEKEVFAKTLVKLTDNVHARMVWHNTRANIDVVMNRSNKCYSISPSKIANGTYIPDESIGTFLFFAHENKTIEKTTSRRMSMDVFMKSYCMGRKLSPAEIEMIPSFDSSWTIPKEAIKICRLIKNSSGEKEPMRNFMLQGPAGTGKTETASLIAAALGLPKVVVTCNADSELFDFVGQVLPDTGMEINDTLPTVQDVCFQPVKAYERLTGNPYPEMGIDQEELLMILFEKVKKNASTSSGFHYTDTPFIQAFRNGWLVEIQEPTVISRPGVLPGLNALLEPNGSITLPTGEVVRRHPDTVVILTTNKDYQGCEDMNQSVKSRMDMIFPIDTLDATEMEERAKLRSGFSDSFILSKMVETVTSISKYLKKNEITSGVCGMRELISWAKAVRIEGKESIFDNAIYCIVQKATDDEEEQEAIIDNFLKPMFGVS